MSSLSAALQVDGWNLQTVKAWCLYQFCRTLGFDADKVGAGLIEVELMHRIVRKVVVRVTDGDRAALLTLGLWTDSSSAWDSEWSDFGDQLVSGELSETQLEAWYNAFFAHVSPAVLATQLLKAGIVIPGAVPSVPRGLSPGSSKA